MDSGCGTQPPCSALSCFSSPPCPTEGLYLGRATAKDDNARARAGYLGARTEWARYQAAPGLTVSVATGGTGPLGNSTWRRSTLRKCPRGGGFLSSDSLISVIARSRGSYPKLLCVLAGSHNMAPGWDS